MPRLSISSLSKPKPVYIPSRLIPGLPSRRRKYNANHQAKQTGSEFRHQKSQRTHDPAMHRKDVDFITSLFVVEQLECESSDDEGQDIIAP